MRLNEEVDVASPIIQPVPLEEDPEYISLGTQAGLCSLAAFHVTPVALQTSLLSGNLPALESAAEINPEFATPREQTGAVEVSKRRRSARRQRHPADGPPPRWSIPRTPLAPVTANIVTPMRAQTIDQVADEGLMSAVVVVGERSPDHAEKKRKAREAAFKGVSAASPSGPYSFYNGESEVPSTDARLCPEEEREDRERFQGAVVPVVRAPGDTISIGGGDAGTHRPSCRRTQTAAGSYGDQSV